MHSKTSPENSVFSTKTSINCKGNLLDLTEPKVMGIINITPDSFYDGGKNISASTVMETASKMFEDGVDIFDIGGLSTRPGSRPISAQEELDRVLPMVEIVNRGFPDIPISIDSYRSEVCKESIVAGAAIINDISAGELDEKMFQTVADLHVPYILMHMKGNPTTMQQNPEYDDPVKELFMYFSRKLSQLKNLGVHDIVLDPGFGFGKNLDHNYSILKRLNDFLLLGHPLLAGVSRKGMIWKALGSSPQEALNGTSVANTIALLNGAKILRVHDVKQAKEAIQIVGYLQKQ